MNAIEKKMTEIAAQLSGLDAHEISSDTYIEGRSNGFGTLGLDSIDKVELVMAVEEFFGIDLPDEAAENLKTIGDFTRYIEKHASPLRMVN